MPAQIAWDGGSGSPVISLEAERRGQGGHGEPQLAPDLDAAAWGSVRNDSGAGVCGEAEDTTFEGPWAEVGLEGNPLSSLLDKQEFSFTKPRGN